MVQIYIDNHERRLQSYFVDDPNVAVEQLEVGDIIIQNDTTKVVLERKTFADLLASISDGRYREQKARMLAAAPAQNCSYIIEGDYDITVHEYTGMVINTIFRDNISVIHTRNMDETVIWIRKIAQQLDKHPEYFGGGSQSGPTYIDCLKVKTKKIANITKPVCYILQLCQIPGISQKIAQEIAKVYPSMPDLIQAIKTASIPDKILCDIPLVGAKKAKAIVEYLM